MSLPWVYVWLFWLSLEKEEMVDIILLLWQTSNNTPNKLLLSESAVSCLLRVRSVSSTSPAMGCIKFVPHICLVSLSHKVGVFLEEAIFFINPAVSEANMVDTCKHFEIGSGSVRSLRHLPVFVIEHFYRAQSATNAKRIK